MIKELLKTNVYGQWELQKSTLKKDVDPQAASSVESSFNRGTSGPNVWSRLTGALGMGKAEDMVGDRIDNSMLISQLEALDHHIKEIREHLDGKEVAPDWVKSKVAVASDKLSDIAHYILGVKEAKK